MISMALLTSVAVSNAVAQAPNDAVQREAEARIDAFGAQGRRANPTEAEVAWSKKAGEIDRMHWPSEIVLKEIEPTLEQFFGALQGRGFDDEQITSLFAESFRGTSVGEFQDVRNDSRAISWTRWQTSEKPSLDRRAFAENWKRRFQLYRQVVRTEHYVDRLQTLDDGETRRLTVPFRVTGYRGNVSMNDSDHDRNNDSSNDGYEDQGQMVVDLQRRGNDRQWQIVIVDLKWMETFQSPSLFTTDTLMPPQKPLDIPLFAFVEYFAQGVTVVDIDGDDDLDVFAPTKFAAPKLYRNDGQRRFSEVSEQIGLGDIRAARSGYFFDWENDGDQDALILTTTRMYLLENIDGSFRDISDASNFDRMSTTGLTGASIADFNNDGLLDFYVANYGKIDNSPREDYFDSNRGFKNQLFRNLGDGEFAMVTQPAGLDMDNARWSFSALSFDYDQDGFQDLYVVNDYGPNQLYRNVGNMTFADVTEEVGVSDFGNGMAASLGDLNGDGREDLYVSNMISHAGKRLADSEDFPGDADARDRLQRFAKGNSLFVARSGKFTESETPTLSDAKWAWGNVLFDYDNDGDLDIYVTNGMYSNLSRKDTDPVFWRHLLAPISTGRPPDIYASGYFSYLVQQESRSFAGYERNRLFQNFGDGRFRDVASVAAADLVLDSRSVVAADLDEDGDLDLVVANRNEPNLLVLWNELPDPGAFVEIELVGTKSNRNGVGAVIEVVCEASKQRRTHQAGSGYLSQGPHSVWFGMGRCQNVERIDVRWPSGIVTRLHNVKVGSRVRVTEE
ncbi:MAG: CRTAC1 family protein [Gammaproteobacteria bacterium]|nr:CRTAC1 family protein [Gammaproteobacteria bacterium]